VLKDTYFKSVISLCNPRYDAWLRPYLITHRPSKVSFHYTILGVTLDKIQFIEALTPTYDVTYI